MPNKSWNEAFTDVIVDYIWADDELRRLMCIPQNATIIDFIERWFVKAGTVTSPLTDEAVRIVYGNYKTYSQGDSHVNKQELSFDIYVRADISHNSESNRLVYRAEKIAERLRHLLTHGERYLSDAYRFWWVGESDMACAVYGYTRHNICFDYIITG